MTNHLRFFLFWKWPRSEVNYSSFSSVLPEEKKKQNINHYFFSLSLCKRFDSLVNLFCNQSIHISTPGHTHVFLSLSLSLCALLCPSHIKSIDVILLVQRFMQWRHFSDQELSVLLLSSLGIILKILQWTLLNFLFS